jgi:hypothetical protein
MPIADYFDLLSLLMLPSQREHGSGISLLLPIRRRIQKLPPPNDGEFGNAALRSSV